ncbi:MAG: metallophosphoesterase [Methylococcales bacterium]|nr:metallophosphoesterase [Methylococcales bacterium]
MKIATFTPNRMGKDFICSDIHGYYDLLEEMLNHVNFNSKKDRLFALGDLIDHGTQSHRVCDYLAKPWFHAVLGNHELMLIEAFESGMEDAAMLTEWNLWGGSWISRQDKQTVAPYYHAMVDLPMAIELILSDGKKVGLLHAQLPEICDWRAVKSTLLAKAQKDNSTATPLTRSILHNKGQVTGSDEVHARILPVENIDHVFHGHTIVDEITTLGNRTFMDLGTYKTGKMGLINPVAFLIKIKLKSEEEMFCV